MRINNHRRSVGQGAAVVCAVAIAAAGCASSSSKKESSSGGADPSSSTSEPAGATSDNSSGSAVSFDQAAAKDVLLTDSDLFGYQAIQEDQLTSALAQSGSITGSLDDVKVTPPECADAFKEQSQGMGRLSEISQSGAVTVLTKGQGAMVTEMIAPKSAVGVDLMKAQTVSDKCAEMTMDIQGVTANITMKPIDVPALGDKAAGTAITEEMQISGKTIKIAIVSIVVEQNGKYLSIGSMGQEADAASVESEIKQIAQQAYDKAEPVLSK